MTRTEVINQTAREIGAITYLELGTRECQNFNQVQVNHKRGVDIRGQSTRAHFRGTTDEFLCEAKREGSKYDLIFIDADHTYDQSKRDFRNALHILSKGGAIILHDCIPLTEREANPEDIKGGVWCGEVWKVWRDIRRRNDLVSVVVDCDHGCGVVMRGERHKGECLTQATWRNISWWGDVISADRFERHGLRLIGKGEGETKRGGVG